MLVIHVLSLKLAENFTCLLSYLSLLFLCARHEAPQFNGIKVQW